MIERITGTLTKEWWQKLLFFLLFASMSYILIYSPLDNLFGFNDYSGPLFLLILVLSPVFIIENYTPNSRWWYIGIFNNLIEQKNILKTIVITLTGFAVLSLIFILFGSSIRFFTYWNSMGIIQIIFSLIIYAIIEEVIYRGVLLRYINEKFGAITTMVVVSMIFSLIHIFNPEISFLSIINIFLFSIVISLVFLRTHSLTIAIIIHSLWNLYQTLILGWNVSGIHYYFSISQFTKNDLPEIISGGRFGLESSITITAVLILNGLLFNKYLKINPEITAVMFRRDYSKI